MQNRNHLIAILIVFTILIALFLTGPALAQDDIDFYRGPDISHSVRYDIDGFISLDKTLGHLCFTGAEKKQTIEGYGKITKLEDVRIVQNLMSNQDDIIWSVPSNALSGLTVTTTIDLCARPMSTAAYNYVYEDRYNILQGDIINPYHPLVVDGLLEINPMTEQIWGTRILTLPGHDGFYDVDFRAAYGPGPLEAGGVIVEPGILVFYEEDYMWWFDENKKRGYDSGDKYVGNYFHIDQHAYNSLGELHRFISMSSPFYLTYLEDKVFVIGQAEIKEAFTMENLEAGPDARTLLWHDLF